MKNRNNFKKINNFKNPERNKEEKNVKRNAGRK